MELPECLEDYQLQGLPQAFYYIPNFISEAEEEFALNKVKTTRYVSIMSLK
jgi:hypothetical protein